MSGERKGVQRFDETTWSSYTALIGCVITMLHSDENTTVAEGNGCQPYTQDQQAGEIPSSKVSSKTGFIGHLLSIAAGNF